MDPFTLIVSVSLLVGLLAIIALGVFHPRSGADVLDWKPTRSPELEAQNDIDDVEQMIAAQNRMRERRGKAARTQADVEMMVAGQQKELSDYADKYWADQREARVAQLNREGGITVYEKTSCSKCQRVARILGERGIEFERVELSEMPGDRIRPLLAKVGLPPSQVLRDEAALKDASDAEALAAMEADPALVQRPIVERGDRAVLARPAERVLDLL